MTTVQKLADRRRRQFLKKCRKELARRCPDYRDEILGGEWDNSPGMREVHSDLVEIRNSR